MAARRALTVLGNTVNVIAKHGKCSDVKPEIETLLHMCWNNSINPIISLY